LKERFSPLGARLDTMRSRSIPCPAVKNVTASVSVTLVSPVGFSSSISLRNSVMRRLTCAWAASATRVVRRAMLRRRRVAFI
jgi:hypothetical protein